MFAVRVFYRRYLYPCHSTITLSMYDLGLYLTDILYNLETQLH